MFERSFVTPVIALILAVGAAVPLVARAAEPFAGWEPVNDEDGIQVFSKEVDGSDLVAFGGTTVMNTPLQKVLYVLATNENRTEWVDRLYISKTLEKISRHEYIVYQAFGLPVILSDRDYVYHGKAVMDANTGIVSLTLESTQHPDAPETVGVRANLINSKYTMTPLGSDRTRVSVEIHTDPKGLIPTWLVNIIQKSWPLKTLRAMREQVGKSHVTLYPLPPPETVAGQ